MDYEESDWDDDIDDNDEFDVDDYDDDEMTDTIPCPGCGEDIYDDAESCPYCGDYIYDGYRGGYSRGWWTFGGALDEWAPFWVFLAVAGVIGVIFSLMVFF